MNSFIIVNANKKIKPPINYNKPKKKYGKLKGAVLFNVFKKLITPSLPQVFHSFLNFNKNKLLIQWNDFFYNKLNSKFISFYSSGYYIDIKNATNIIMNYINDKSHIDNRTMNNFEEDEIMIYYNQEHFESSLNENESSYNLSLNNFDILSVSTPSILYKIFLIGMRKNNELKEIKLSVFGKGFLLLPKTKHLIMKGQNIKGSSMENKIYNLMSLIRYFLWINNIGIIFFIRFIYFKNPELSEDNIKNFAHFVFFKPILISFGLDFFVEYGFLTIDFNYLKQDLSDFIKTEEYNKNMNVYKKYLFFDNIFKLGFSLVLKNNMKSPIEIMFFLKTTGVKNSILIALNKWFFYEYKKPITIFKSVQLIHSIIQ